MLRADAFRFTAHRVLVISHRRMIHQAPGDLTEVLRSHGDDKEKRQGQFFLTEGNEEQPEIPSLPSFPSVKKSSSCFICATAETARRLRRRSEVPGGSVGTDPTQREPSPVPPTGSCRTTIRVAGRDWLRAQIPQTASQRP